MEFDNFVVVKFLIDCVCVWSPYFFYLEKKKKNLWGDLLLEGINSGFTSKPYRI